MWTTLTETMQRILRGGRDQFQLLRDETNNKKESEEALSLINLELDKLNKLFNDKERLHKTLLEKLNKEKLVTERVYNEWVWLFYR